MSLQERIWSALAEIDDPEMPINLVDLGVIYGVALEDRTVRLRLTFTAMGCPASDMIIGDIRERLLAEPGVDAVAIDVVWDPPWSSSRMTSEGRETLRAWGLSV
jgi:metal-sulfur cluster biosynthetic enzyme